MADSSDDRRQHFLVDLMLMRLGRWLRFLGRDAANPEEESDSGLMEQARRECRTIITRDKSLFSTCNKHDLPCILIRSSLIEEQLLEMACFGVDLRLDPQRCTICNGPLEAVEGVGAKTWRCSRCNHAYWVGSHWDKMMRTLEEIGRARRSDCQSDSGKEHSRQEE